MKISQEIHKKDRVPEHEKFEVYIDSRLTIPAIEREVRKNEKINYDVIRHLLSVTRNYGNGGGSVPNV